MVLEIAVDLINGCFRLIMSTLGEELTFRCPSRKGRVPPHFQLVSAAALFAQSLG